MIGDHLKRLVRGSVIYGMGSMLNRLLSFLLVPVFTRYLRPEDYGVMAMLGVLTVVLTGLFSLGTGNSMGICYFGEEDRTERPRIVWTTAGLLLVNTAVWLTAGLFAAPLLSQALLRGSEHTDLVFLALAALAINTLATPFSSYLRLEERARTFVIISIVTALVSLGLNVLGVVFLGRGVRGMLEAALGSSLVLLVLTVVAVSPSLRFGMNRRWVPQLVTIGLPSVFGLGAFFFIDWIDRVMLQRMAGMHELGLYSVGYSFGMVMALVAEGAFGSAWPPFFLSFINKRAEAIVLFGKIFKYFIFGCGTLALIFFALAQPIVTLMTEEAFHSAHTVVGLVATAYMLKVCYLILLPGIVFEKKLHIQTGIEWIAALLNVGLNLLLIPILKKEGAAIATLCSYLSLAILAYFIGQKYLAVEYDKRSIGKYVAGFVLSAVVFYFGYTGLIWRDVGIKGAVLVAYCGMVYRCILTSGERQLALSFITRVRPKFLPAKA